MNPIGEGPLMTVPLRIPMTVPNGAPVSASHVQPVIVHGVLTPDGRIVETEIAQTSNASLNQRALAVVGQMNMGDRTLPGATPRQQEVFVNVKFLEQ